MVTFEQLRKIARENVTDLMLMELLKEFPHLNPDRANHVCCYIARMLGLANQYVYNHEEWNYVGEVGNETIMVHPDHGIKFGDINKMILEEQEDLDEEEDLCQCEDCVRSRQQQEELRAQASARISENSSAPLISGVIIDEASEVVPQSVVEPPPVVEPPALSSEYPVFEMEEPPIVQTSGTFNIEDSTFRWWNGSQIRREIEEMNRYYNYISPNRNRNQ